MELLRFTTAGSVDDGKSTLIGRLLYDSKAIFEDQLDALELTRKRRGEENINLALLTDGLRAEREQGITIDVAYRYFSTPKRKFIIADTPGHVQYTRNMVTGASTANAALVLIDARNGVVEQTIRHAYIAFLLKIPHLIVCINKMDLVNFQEDIFLKIKNDFLNISQKLNFLDISFLPISAKFGDNVVEKSANISWHSGETLLSFLENLSIEKDENFTDLRFPVQNVIRPQNEKFHDFRGYAGRIASGIFKVGEKITILPSLQTSTISQIYFATETLEKALPSQSVTLLLSDNIDISRGDMIVGLENLPNISQDISTMLCWFNSKPLNINAKYILRHTTTEMRCLIKNIDFKIDINSLQENIVDRNVGMNDIAKVQLRTSKPLFFDSYAKNRVTGSLILIDEGTNETVAAGMIL